MKKTNLILALVLLVSSTFAYWYEFRKKVEIEKVKEQSSKLLVLPEQAKLTRLRFFDQEKKIDSSFFCQSGCRVQDSNSAWLIDRMNGKPVQFKADESNLVGFLTSFIGNTVQDKFSINEVKLSEIGLDESQRAKRYFEVAYRTANSDSSEKKVLFYLGENLPVGENMYVISVGDIPSSGQEIRILPAYLKTNFQHEDSYWRAKRFFDFAVSEIEAVELKQSTGEGFSLLREQNGNWSLPQKRPVDNEAVDTYLTGLIYLNATRFVSDDKIADRKKLGLPSIPRARLKVVTKKETVFVELYDVVTDVSVAGKKEKQPKLYVTLSNQKYIAEMDRSNIDKFTKRSDSFRFRNLLSPAELENTQKVVFSFEEKKVQFLAKKEKNQWRLDSGVYSHDEIETALGKVAAARVSEFFNKPPVGFKEISHWSFSANNSADVFRTFSILFNPKASDGSSQYAVAFSNGEFGKLEIGSGSAIPKKIEDLKNK